MDFAGYCQECILLDIVRNACNGYWWILSGMHVMDIAGYCWILLYRKLNL